jgi:MFS family permease
MSMIGAERRAAAALGGIYALRMLGIFLVLPVLALAARDLTGATPVLIGVAVGIYGLTQAGLQVPFGFASDRLGRKPVIAFGLLLFIAGSALAAVADSIAWLVLGRALQGAGAIAAALMALAADLTRDAVRTRVMAVIGVSIGAAFSGALVLGPLLHAGTGLAGLFWIAAGLGVAALVLLYTVVPTPRARVAAGGVGGGRERLRAVLANRDLLRLDAGIFVLHLIMTATFVAAPLSLDAAGLPDVSHWRVYLPVFLASVVGMAPLVLAAERFDRTKTVFLIAVALVAAAHGVLGVASADVVGAALGLAVFFTGFNVLEATLPALVSKSAPAADKGAAMGVYSACQFLGAFVGGLGGGWLDRLGGPALVFAGLATVAVLWLLASFGMRVPRPGSTIAVALDGGSDDAAATLSTLPGVDQAIVVAAEDVAYLEIDPECFDPAALERAGYRVSNGEPADLAPVR